MDGEIGGRGRRRSNLGNQYEEIVRVPVFSKDTSVRLNSIVNIDSEEKAIGSETENLTLKNDNPRHCWSSSGTKNVASTRYFRFTISFIAI